MFDTFGQSSQMSLCIWTVEAIDLITNKAITITNALTSCLILINYNMFPDTDMSVRRTSSMPG